MIKFKVKDCKNQNYKQEILFILCRLLNEKFIIK